MTSDIQMEYWETRSLLLNHVEQNPPCVVVGNDTEAPRGFFSCVVDGVDNQIHIGVITNQSKTPRAIFFPVSRRVILGYDESVAVIDCLSAILRRAISLDGVFFEFLWDEEQAQIIAVHELGVVAISAFGEELWRYTTKEILEDWSMVNRRLILMLMDTDASVELNLEDGAPAR